MKFVHTADWHIGMKFGSFDPEHAKIARKARLEAAERLVRMANENHAELILIAGDLFQDNAVDRSTVTQTANILSKFNGRVFIIPGNHDPLVPGSVWDHATSWKSYQNITIFRRNEPEDLPGCVIYPCVASSKYNSCDPTEWIEAADRDKISIGMAHGNVNVLQVEAKDTPMPENAPELRGLDYLALGHWHSSVLFGKGEVRRMAYSGTHEQGSFRESGGGNALLVEIADRHATPVITTLRTGGLRWNSASHEMGAEEDLNDLSRKMAAIESPEKTILELTLNGFLFPNTMDELDRLSIDWRKRFLAFNMDVSGMRPSPRNDEWLNLLPRGIVRDTASDLIGMAQGETRESLVAIEALMELYKISHEVPK